MINCLVVKTDFQALPNHYKNQIEAVSTSKKESNFEEVTLDSIVYYHISAPLELALVSPLSRYELHSMESVTEIIESGSYTPRTSVVLEDPMGIPLRRSSNANFDPDIVVKHKGIIDQTVALGQTVNLDYKIDQLTYDGENVPSFMTGVGFKVSGGNDGDNADFLLIDKDNVLGLGTDYIIGDFGKNFYLFPNKEDHIKEHMADLIPDTYVRIIYRNTGLVAARFICNLYRYIRVA